MKSIFWFSPPYRSLVSKTALLLLSFFVLDLLIFSTEPKQQLSRQDYYVFSDLARPFKHLSLFKHSLVEKNEIEHKILLSVPSGLRSRLNEVLGMTLRLSEWYGIDPFWILAIMWTESDYRTQSVSVKGAIGPMQLLPSSFSFLEQNQANPLYSVFHDSWPWSLERSFMQKRWGWGVLERRRIFASNSFCGGEGPRWSISSLLRPSYYPARTHIRDPLTNIESGILYLRCLLEAFDQDPHLATMAYNMGPTKLMGRLKRNKGQIAAAPLGSPETSYLKKVKRAYQLLTYAFPLQS